MITRLSSADDINITVFYSVEENRQDAAIFTINVDRVEVATGRLNPRRDNIVFTLQHGDWSATREPSFLRSDVYVLDGDRSLRFCAKRGERSTVRLIVNEREQIDPVSGRTDFSIAWV